MGLSRKFCEVALATGLSRLSGFLRDVVLFGTLGTSDLSAAFLFAFTLPNLLRRLLGEGALSSALIPIFSQEYCHKDRPAAFRLLHQVFSRTTLLLMGILLPGAGLLWGLAHLPGLEERHYLGFRLALFLLPFAPLICLTALTAAALNGLGHFFRAATPALGLNLCLILGLWISGLAGGGMYAQICGLVGGVLLGGLLPLCLLMGQLRRQGWHWRWDWDSSPALVELQKLFLPGLAGAAVLQLNLAVSRLLAFALRTDAIPLLYIAERLVDLPLGLFVVTLTTLFFPQMSRSAVLHREEEFAKQSRQGLELVLLISVPAAVGLGLLGREILQMLFAWGQFRARDVTSALPVLRIFALSLPFSALSIFLTRICHARKNTRLPVRISLGAFAINLSLTLLLLRRFQVPGMAWAHVLATLFQSICLGLRLRSTGTRISLRTSLKPVGGILLSSALMGIVLAVFLKNGFFPINLSRTRHALRLLTLIVFGMGTYFATLFLCHRCPGDRRRSGEARP